MTLPAGMIIGGYPLLILCKALPSIIVYGAGRSKADEFPKIGIVTYALACIVYALCAASY